MKEQEALEFPCTYPVKAMGLNKKDFVEEVAAIVSAHAGEIAPESMASKVSENAKYVSITIQVYAPTREFLEGIYVDLRMCPKVLVVL
jgi:putative lipoic acid-binding regulatory protein